jgi:hypothetical protein
VRHIIISESLRKKCGGGEKGSKEGKMKNMRVKRKHNKRNKKERGGKPNKNIKIFECLSGQIYLSPFIICILAI